MLPGSKRRPFQLTAGTDVLFGRVPVWPVSQTG